MLCFQGSCVIDPCNPNPCHNNSKNHHLITSNQKKEFNCDYSARISGELSETKFDS
jgi:hypothetical protein